jgi:hypothetical protein
MTADPDRISTPLAVAREPVTRSSRTKAGFTWASAAKVVRNVAVQIKTAKTTKMKPDLLVKWRLAITD